jgi:DNA-binding response OmpR family regulator
MNDLRLGHGTVLIVEDEQALREAMIRQLERAGHRVLSASNAEDARALMGEHDVDVLVADINLPDESGVMLLRDVHENGWSVASLMVTGVDNPDIAAAALELGAYGYLIKPVQATQLTIAVSNALIRLNLERDLRNDVQELEDTLDRAEEEIAVISQQVTAQQHHVSAASDSRRELIVAAQTRLRDSETVLLGQGEIAVVLRGADAVDLKLSADALADALLEQPEVEGCRVRADVGAAAPSATAQQTVHDADVACFSASRRPDPSTAVYDANMPDSLRGTLGLQRDLLPAVNNGQITAFFDPVINLQDDRVYGVHVVPRWKHPDRGLLPHTVFLPLAAQLGLADTVTIAMIRSACSALAHWNEQHPDRRLWAGVNVSAGQLLRGRVIDDIANALSVTGVQPGQLVVHLHEHAISDHEDALHGPVQATSSAQGAWGCTICMIFPSIW